MNAGGAYTWNLPRRSIKPTKKDPKAWYMIESKLLKYIKEITDGLDDYVIPEEKRCNADGTYNMNWKEGPLPTK